MPEAADPSEGSSRFRDAALAQLPSLHRLAFHLSRDAFVADDLVQETYLLAFRSADTFQDRSGGIRPWLFKIMHNAYRLRARREGRVVFDDELVEERPEEPSVEMFASNSRLDELNWDLVDESLKSAIHALPESLREVFLLFAVEDLKYREISDVLAVPVGTVMSRLARARKMLVSSLPVSSAKSAIQNGSRRIVSNG